VTDTLPTADGAWDSPDVGDLIETLADWVVSEGRARGVGPVLWLGIAESRPIRDEVVSHLNDVRNGLAESGGDIGWLLLAACVPDTETAIQVDRIVYYQPGGRDWVVARAFLDAGALGPWALAAGWTHAEVADAVTLIERGGAGADERLLMEHRERLETLAMLRGWVFPHR
jgi:hypothetical protein